MNLFICEEVWQEPFLKYQSTYRHMKKYFRLVSFCSGILLISFLLSLLFAAHRYEKKIYLVNEEEMRKKIYYLVN
jgi:hypothetical protein